MEQVNFESNDSDDDTMALMMIPWSRCFVLYLYSFVVYLYVNGSGSITSVGEERANLSAVVYL